MNADIVIQLGCKLEHVFDRPELKHVLVAFVKHRLRERIVDRAFCILCDEAPAHIVPPRRHVDALEVDVRARVGLVAANDTSWQNSARRLQISQSDVSDVDPRLRWAALQRVKHTAWATAIWLLLLLWADVDAPPNRVVHADTIVRDVRDNTVSHLTWVGLDIDCFQRILEVNVLKSDVLYARIVLVRRNGADRHANAKDLRRVADVDILGAVVFGDIAAFRVARLGHYGIIICLNLDVFDVNV